MKIIRKIFKIICSIFLFLVIAFIGLNIYRSIDKVDTFYLGEAQFSDYRYLTLLDKLLETEDFYSLKDEANVYIHRLSKGKGVIFAYRTYTNGSMAMDDEGFKKFTIWLSKLPENFPTDLNLSNNENIKAAYTTGGSAWPRTACSGYFKSGSLILNKSGSLFEVSFNGVFSPAGSRSFGDYCKKEELEIEFTASELEFADLTPWLGLKGDHPYAETYR
ncbi:MAG: hypothetical protein JKX81_06035 [Arenicella sp.]|nr:hypothetical protein [Arenicella sp.]